jgi:hypothetical protein
VVVGDKTPTTAKTRHASPIVSRCGPSVVVGHNGATTLTHQRPTTAKFCKMDVVLLKRKNWMFIWEQIKTFDNHFITRINIEMENLPTYVSIVFGLTTLLTVYIFYTATKKSKLTLILLLTWLVIQAGIGLTGFYTVTDTLPPRFLLLVLPPLLFIIGLFTTSKGKQYVDSLEIKTLTILHIIRIPVEIVLFCLFVYKTIPQLMTFEGRNFDILAGLTAPIIFYFGFIRKQLKNKVILVWNFICLGLLLNIVINAVLSAPFPFQQFAFDQPDIALFYFPFVWLPCCVVPLVLLSHLASLRQLLNSDRQKKS